MNPSPDVRDSCPPDVCIPMFDNSLFKEAPPPLHRVAVTFFSELMLFVHESFAHFFTFFSLTMASSSFPLLLPNFPIHLHCSPPGCVSTSRARHGLPPSWTGCLSRSTSPVFPQGSPSDKEEGPPSPRPSFSAVLQTPITVPRDPVFPLDHSFWLNPLDLHSSSFPPICTFSEFSPLRPPLIFYVRAAGQFDGRRHALGFCGPDHTFPGAEDPWNPLPHSSLSVPSFEYPVDNTVNRPKGSPNFSFLPPPFFLTQIFGRDLPPPSFIRVFLFSQISLACVSSFKCKATNGHRTLTYLALTSNWRPRIPARFPWCSKSDFLPPPYARSSPHQTN